MYIPNWLVKKKHLNVHKSYSVPWIVYEGDTIIFYFFPINILFYQCNKFTRWSIAE